MATINDRAEVEVALNTDNAERQLSQLFRDRSASAGASASGGDSGGGGGRGTMANPGNPPSPPGGGGGLGGSISGAAAKIGIAAAVFAAATSRFRQDLGQIGNTFGDVMYHGAQGKGATFFKDLSNEARAYNEASSAGRSALVAAGGDMDKETFMAIREHEAFMAERRKRGHKQWQEWEPDYATQAIGKDMQNTINSMDDLVMNFLGETVAKSIWNAFSR